MEIILYILLLLYVVFINVLVIKFFGRIREKKKESQNTAAPDHSLSRNISRCEPWYIGRTFKRIPKK